MIGRADGCNLRSHSQRVSRYHCAIQLANGAVTIQDLGGVNGTFVNGSRVTDIQTLNDGDRINVGTHKFSISIQSGADSETNGDEGDFFELTPTSFTEPLNIKKGTRYVGPVAESLPNAAAARPAKNAKLPVQEPELMFDIRLDGKKVSVTKARLFDLAKTGFISPDDLVTVAGTKIFADSVQGIVFGTKSSASVPSPAASSSAPAQPAAKPTAPPNQPAAESDTFAFPDLGADFGNLTGNLAEGQHPFGDMTSGPVVRAARRTNTLRALWQTLDISFSRIYTMEDDNVAIHSIKALYYIIVCACLLCIFWVLFYFVKTCIGRGEFLAVLSEQSFPLTVVIFGCVTFVIIVRVLIEMLLLAWLDSSASDDRGD
ncbi:MAG: FHA domain-containing protein [Planctomycetaceae bacterium]|nr:FHA domain-containing protein [Planctomycetaceae bacterium]